MECDDARVYRLVVRLTEGYPDPPTPALRFCEVLRIPQSPDAPRTSSLLNSKNPGRGFALGVLKFLGVCCKMPAIPVVVLFCLAMLTYKEHRSGG